MLKLHGSSASQERVLFRGSHYSEAFARQATSLVAAVMMMALMLASVPTSAAEDVTDEVALTVSGAERQACVVGCITPSHGQ